MIVIRYVDIYEAVETEEGIVEKVSLKDATLPIVINPQRVVSVQPYFNGKGKVFKNVSYINYEGELLKVVGNYKALDNKILNDEIDTRIQIKGFKRYD